MSDARWIVIPRWDEFQHPDVLRSNTPPWIKNWTRLLHDDAYLGLTDLQRAILHGLWLLYAATRRQVPLSTRSLSRQLNLRVSSVQLKALNDAGFIQLSASKPASPEKIRRETPFSPYKRTAKTEVESRPASAAYQPFQNGYPGATVDPVAALELARRLSRGQ